jgi:hypothetical protein
VTAGIDMAASFVRYFIGLHLPPSETKAMGDKVLGILEVSYVTVFPRFHSAEASRELAQDEDKWADYYGLI